MQVGSRVRRTRTNFIQIHLISCVPYRAGYEFVIKKVEGDGVNAMAYDGEHWHALHNLTPLDNSN